MTLPARATLVVVGMAAVAAACRAPAPVASPARDGWSTMSWEDKHDTMTFAVLPNMARTFQRFAGSSAPDMTCATCHGTDAELVQYAMPHGLPALDPTHLPDRNATDPKEARIAKFMFDEVTPAMADLVGVPLYDPKTKQGFSCFSCHPSR